MKPHNFLLLFSLFLLFNYFEVTQNLANAFQLRPKHNLGYNRCSEPFRRTTTLELNRRRSIHRAAHFRQEEDEDQSEDSPMGKWAQAYAEYLAGLRDSPPSGRYGYLWRSFRPGGSDDDAYSVVEWLYRRGYDIYEWYGEEPPQDRLEEYATFSAMVWAASRTIAIGCADDIQGEWRYLVVAIRPPGNWWGGFAENVRPPRVWSTVESGEEEEEVVEVLIEQKQEIKVALL